MQILRSKQLLGLLLIGISLLQLSVATSKDSGSDLKESDVPHVRHKRGFFWDFFQKIAITKNLITDQYADTRNTLNDIYNTVNEQFSDPGPMKPTSQPRSTTERVSSSDEEGSDLPSSTTEGFSISRYELGRILGRNFRGIQRLAQTEFQEALNATHYNLKEYKAEADKQFANSLAVEKKKTLKSLKG
ncbi:uncharacterized protein LOC133848178 [Drosophila sulfurigaster albostrigata]|uniref:uncharacterized protein LOC133848178 n=1 Tax=Drosophila sulfurigaster albostrigata TaxID=89887 RepID=UPI002D21C70E|nr:uncharacterized protein LOC133848178 [Drosophila sulfurigaster albostrigata]